MKLKKLTSCKIFGTLLVNYFLKIAIIAVLLLIASCGGTRNTDIQSKEQINVNNTYSTGSKVVLGSNLTFTPFDNSMPYSVDGKEYINVIVSNTKYKEVVKWKYANITKTIRIEKTKTVERKNNTYLYLGLAFIIALFIFLGYYLPKIRIPGNFTTK
jgi:hypothetical protein